MTLFYLHSVIVLKQKICPLYNTRCFNIHNSVIFRYIYYSSWNIKSSSFLLSQEELNISSDILLHFKITLLSSLSGVSHVLRAPVTWHFISDCLTFP